MHPADSPEKGVNRQDFPRFNPVNLAERGLDVSRYSSNDFKNNQHLVLP